MSDPGSPGIRARRVSRRVAVPLALVMVAVAGAGSAAPPRGDGTGAAPPPAPAAAAQPTGSPAASPSASPSVPRARRPPAGLPVIEYLLPLPKGFPPDPTPMSTEQLTEGARVLTKLAVYDAPGGRPRAYLTPEISGVPVTVPIVQRRSGWVAVLLPSGNRTIGWLPPAGWATTPLRDQILVHRKRHKLTWVRDGVAQKSWTVSIGSDVSPTPLGRTFVLGRGRPTSHVYAGLDVLALGAVPDDPYSVPPALRGAHIGIHSWYQNTFGGNSSDGCVQVPKAGQRLLLDEIVPGTQVVVLP
ncbi:MAG TPA: L,D-transpeptidase [Pilimelia sp.]|nr:L,D-transpeptidase [Pilimelia sp.]